MYLSHHDSNRSGSHWECNHPPLHTYENSMLVPVRRWMQWTENDAVNLPKNPVVLYHGVLNLRMELCNWRQNHPVVWPHHGTLLNRYFLHCLLHGWKSHSSTDQMFLLWSWNGLWNRKKKINFKHCCFIQKECEFKCKLFSFITDLNASPI